MKVVGQTWWLEERVDRSRGELAMVQGIELQCLYRGMWHGYQVLQNRMPPHLYCGWLLTSCYLSTFWAKCAHAQIKVSEAIIHEICYGAPRTKCWVWPGSGFMFPKPRAARDFILLLRWVGGSLCPCSSLKRKSKFPKFSTHILGICAVKNMFFVTW